MRLLVVFNQNQNSYWPQIFCQCQVHEKHTEHTAIKPFPPRSHNNECGYTYKYSAHKKSCWSKYSKWQPELKDKIVPIEPHSAINYNCLGYLFFYWVLLFSDTFNIWKTLPPLKANYVFWKFWAILTLFEIAFIFNLSSLTWPSI